MRSDTYRRSSSQSSHHSHHHSSGGYHASGPADTSPIVISGLDETFRDDRADFHLITPASHGDKAHSGQGGKQPFRRRFRQFFFRFALVVLACALVFALAWGVISALNRMDTTPAQDENAVVFPDQSQTEESADFLLP